MARIRDWDGPGQAGLEPVRYHYGMSDLTAGVALGQTTRLPFLPARRSKVAARYLLSVDSEPLQNAGRFGMCANNPIASMRRARHLGIEVDRPVRWALHRLAGGAFSDTEAAYHSTMSVPLYPALSDRKVDVIARALPEIFG